MIPPSATYRFESISLLLIPTGGTVYGESVEMQHYLQRDYRTFCFQGTKNLERTIRHSPETGGLGRAAAAVNLPRMIRISFLLALVLFVAIFNQASAAPADEAF